MTQTVDNESWTMAIVLTLGFVYMIYQQTVAWWPEDVSDLEEANGRQNTAKAGLGFYMALLLVTIPGVLATGLGQMLAEWELVPFADKPQAAEVASADIAASSARYTTPRIAWRIHDNLQT
jgi:hypothetical protein